MVEQKRAPADKEQKADQPRHCLIIPGMLATNAEINSRGSYKVAFAKKYGAENVSVFNSAISTDRPDPNRFDQIADVVMSHAATGLDLVLHSLGSSEFRKVTKIIRKKDKRFFDDPKVQANLRIILIGPSGFNRGFARLTYPYRANQLQTKPGFDGLSAFPPRNVKPQDLSATLGRISNKRGGVRVLALENPRTNVEYLSPADREKLTRHDIRLEKAVKRRARRATLRTIEKRAKSVRGPLRQVFEGTTEKRNSKKGIWRGWKSGGMVFLSAGGAKPMRTLRRLYGSGIEVKALVPEYDRTVPIRKIIKFYGSLDEAKRHTIVLEQLSHASLALQADIYADSIHTQNPQ